MKDRKIEFEKIGPDTWKVAEGSEDDMEDALDRALAAGGFPSMQELRDQLGL